MMLGFCFLRLTNGDDVWPITEHVLLGMKQCLSLQPNHPQALTNLGNIYMEWYAFAITTLNLLDSISMRYNGFPLFKLLFRNMITAAASYYKATLSVTTGLSAPFNNLAIIYKQQVLIAIIKKCS